MHHFNFVPALVFSKEIRDYNFFEQFWFLGSLESNGVFAIRKKYPPYKDLDSNQVKGMLFITIIEPSSCWACKDSKDLLNFLSSRFGLRFSVIRVIDVNAQETPILSERYAVQYAPAALIQGELMLFEGMKELWPKIGRVFEDGVYAFDNPPVLGEGYYYDLNSKKIVAATLQFP
jgi:hypothetical protein